MPEYFENDTRKEIWIQDPYGWNVCLLVTVKKENVSTDLDGTFKVFFLCELHWLDCSPLA